MAENISAEIRRDTELEQRMLEAVIADRNAQPRSQQLQVGPSQVGGCRELLRAGLFESDTLAEPETNYAAAAHVGSVMGAEYEKIFGERLDALTQQRITAMFGMLGVQISGATDLLFVDGDQISDLKSTDDIGGVLYDLKRNASIIETLLAIRAEGLLYAKNIETPDGGYELTEVLVSKLAKLHYYVQIAIYVIGAGQQGVLSADGTGRLVFYDRSGQYQGFVALIVTAEEISLFYDIAQMRMQQVVEAQMAFEETGGNPAVIAPLRDMAPSYCFSPKVMCPRRMHCWGGSDWAADNQITNAEHISAVNRYVVGRDLEKLGKGMKSAARAELKDVTGMLPDGKMVTWGGNGAINIVETTVTTPQTQARLDEFVPPVDVVGEIAAEHDRVASGQASAEVAARAMRERELGKLPKPELLDLVEQLTGERPVGVKAKLIGIILDEEAKLAEHGDPSSQPVDEPVDIPAPPIPVPNGVYITTDLPDEPFGERIESASEWTDEGDLTAQTGPEFADPEPRHAEAVAEGMHPAEQGFVEAEYAPDPDFTPSWDGAQGANASTANPELPTEESTVRTQQSVAHTQDGEVRTTGVHFEDSGILQRRQELFGLTLEELQGVARGHNVAYNVPRQFMIQAIIDTEFPPPADRGWRPNGEGTSGDQTTDRLRQMQYNSDPAMRRNYEGGAQ